MLGIIAIPTKAFYVVEAALVVGLIGIAWYGWEAYKETKAEEDQK